VKKALQIGLVWALLVAAFSMGSALGPSAQAQVIDDERARNDVELQVSATVSAAANNQTLAAAAGKRTYITGFSITGAGATAASTVLVTITGLPNTLNYAIPIPAGANAVVLSNHVVFPRPIAASADNTAIVVNVPSFGAGNLASSVTAFGFQRPS